MKEVKLKHYAGPFKEKPPFEYFMQSSIGPVPKADDQTRLIFHLSYDFGESWEQKSFNFHTPDKICSVSYNDLDHAVANCLRILKQNPGIQILFFAKTDLTLAFRQVPGHPSFYRWLCMKATNPDDGQTYYFVDKCLPFGAHISCALFQELSDALAHISQAIIKRDLGSCKTGLTNYLDDYLFIAIAQAICNVMVDKFIAICEEIGLPISAEKMEWADLLMIFLGILMDDCRKLLVIPEEKRCKAIYTIRTILVHKKATVKQLQCLMGLLNFLGRAVVPGRAFTR